MSGESGLAFDDEDFVMDDVVSKRVTVVELPTPDAQVVSTYETENQADFKLPFSYVRYQQRHDEMDETSLEYDLDNEDTVSPNCARMLS